MKGKKSFIHRAQKEWDSTDGHDMNEKNRIAVILRDNHIRHYPLFDQTIFINKQTHKWQMIQPEGYTSKEDLWRDWETFMPDLLFPKKKNEYYEYAGIRLMWFTAEQVKGWSDAELFLQLIDRL